MSESEQDDDRGRSATVRRVVAAVAVVGTMIAGGSAAIDVDVDAAAVSVGGSAEATSVPGSGPGPGDGAVAVCPAEGG